LKHYIDASVLAAYYHPEPLSGATHNVMSRIDVPVISALTCVELRSALSLKVRSGVTDAKAARSILGLFRDHLAAGMYVRIAIGEDAYTLAEKWLETFGSPLRTLDALHLAAAHLDGMILVTADKALARSASHFGVRHLTVS